MSDKFKRYYEKLGIPRELSAPYTSQQNGVVERKNIMVVEMILTLLKGA